MKAGLDVYILPRRAGQWLDPAVPLKEKGWQTGLGIGAPLPSEEYQFWGEKIPVTVDDPETVARVHKKMGQQLHNEVSW